MTPLYAGVIDLQDELAAVRVTLHAATTALHELQIAARKLKATQVRLIEETRELRAFVMKLDTAA